VDGLTDRDRVSPLLLEASWTTRPGRVWNSTLMLKRLSDGHGRRVAASTSNCRPAAWFLFAVDVVTAPRPQKARLSALADVATAATLRHARIGRRDSLPPCQLCTIRPVRATPLSMRVRHLVDQMPATYHSSFGGAMHQPRTRQLGNAGMVVTFGTCRLVGRTSSLFTMLAVPNVSMAHYYDYILVQTAERSIALHGYSGDVNCSLHSLQRAYEANIFISMIVHPRLCS